MKKHALALAVLAAAVPGLALADGPTVYGKLNASLDNVDTDTGVPATSTTIWNLNSNASRIGIRGDADTFLQGVKGLYYAEFGVKADDGVASGVSPFSQRNIYLGLKTDYGTLRAGKIDTPLKDAQGKFDQFNDLAADIQNIGAGETRADNIVYFTSQKYIDGALAFNLALSPGEGKDIDDGDGDHNTATGVEDGLTDYLSASVVYEKDAWYAALAVAQNNSGSNNVDGFTDIDAATAGSQSVADLVRAVVVYKTDTVEGGFLYQTADDVASGSNKSDATWALSGAYKYDKWKFKGQYGVGEGDGGKSKTLLGVGADFSAGKGTTIYGYYASVDTDNVAPAVDTALTTFGIGLDQKF